MTCGYTNILLEQLRIEVTAWMNRLEKRMVYKQFDPNGGDFYRCPSDIFYQSRSSQ